MDYVNKAVRYEGVNGGSDNHRAKVKTAEIKAQRRASRNKQVRMMRRSSSSVVVDAGMAEKFKMMAQEEGQKQECLTPTRVSFDPGFTGGGVGAGTQYGPGLGRSVSEGGEKKL